VQQSDSDSIEFRIMNTGLNTSFLDITSQQKVLESRWLFGYTYTMVEGKYLSLIKPSDCYDGLITCYKTEPPRYL
ncbi:erythromycin esterase, partial [Bacillus subtilis]|nr:erythromycin esterase [Bacillus subtilis]